MTQMGIGTPEIDTSSKLAVVYWDDAPPNAANYPEFQFGYGKATRAWFVILNGSWQPAGRSTEIARLDKLNDTLESLLTEIMALREAIAGLSD